MIKKINSFEEYKSTYKKSIENPEQFWGEIAENFTWRKKWSKVLSWDFTKPEVKWFEGGKLNITENCLDRHLAERSDKVAILFEPNDINEKAVKLTYKQLHEKVSHFSNVLKNNGVKKGDRVCIYLPMIPELAIATLACARIGAIHSIVFAGFSATALASRINDSDCKVVLTSDGGYRGNKTIDLKGIVDEAIENCKCIAKSIVYKRTGAEVTMKANRDVWWHDELQKADPNCPAEDMDAEDPLFILYTSGSTGTPKGMVHTTAGYMIYAAYTFKNVFQYEESDIYWCTADIGWITGHSYILYGPLANGATTVMFEGVPTYPDGGRFWEVIAKHKVTQFYTAPTAIRALEKQPIEMVDKHDLSSLKVLGSVGEPINAEAWHWYDDNIGKKNCPIVDTWWQTETGGIMITSLAGITPQKPTYATLPMIGIQPALMDENGKEITAQEAEGRLAIKFPWPGIARTVYGDHKRYKETYFSAYAGKYFTGDGALRDTEGNYRITGRVDDVVIVSGHNLGTAPIEDVIDEHHKVVECAIVGFPHDIKGSALYAYVTLYDGVVGDDELRKEINNQIAKSIGPIAKLDKIQFVNGLPKTRSGKIMRRILRKVASSELDTIGDTSTLLNPECVEEIIAGVL
jgi:acetyl-CoA synthetase